jgi:hypothetical protein
MKNMVAPTFRSAGAELKLSATARRESAQRGEDSSHQPAIVSQHCQKPRKLPFLRWTTSLFVEEKEKSNFSKMKNQSANVIENKG